MKVPLSGAVAGFKGDLKIGLGQQLTGEVKSRIACEGFTSVCTWLAGNDALFLFNNGRDRGLKAVVLAPHVYFELMYKTGYFCSGETQSG